MKNIYGLDTAYFKKKLECIVRDIDSYTPEEMRTALGQLSNAACVYDNARVSGNSKVFGYAQDCGYSRLEQ